MIKEMGTKEWLKRFEDRKELTANKERVEREQLAEKLRQDYLKRTGRTEMKP